MGLFMCGDVEDYLDALKIFAGSITSKSDKMEKALESGDLENYTTLVHSLKSSARTIGALKLSDMAKALETAGKNGDEDTIKKETPKLLEEYRSLEKELDTL